MQEQVGNVSREKEILRKNKKGMPETKKPVTEIKNSLDVLISRLAMDARVIRG